MRTRRPYLVRCAAGFAAAAIVATAIVPAAPAAPLDDQTCQQLKREVGDLEGIGARANLVKGPVWGKVNLSYAQLEQVKKLIEIDEAVAFRCSRPKPVPEVKPVVVPTKTKAKQPPKGAPKVKAPDAKAVAKQPPVKAKAGTPTAAVPDGKAPAAAAPTPPAKPKPKPANSKAQDAFTPPPQKAAEPVK